jgi:[ribosomal protein S5]-alanine N-acetyltransferase
VTTAPIRPLTRADSEELARLLSGGRDLDAAYVPERDDSFFTAEGQRVRIEGALYLFGILDGEAIGGTIGLSNVAGWPFESASVGYWVAAERRGRGLATAAVAALADVAFGDLDLHRLEAATLVDNRASQRVLEKCGFTRIGLAPRYLWIAGAWQDHVLYQRTADD